MTTYRPGTHHGVTINREGDGFVCARPGHDCARGHIVAVVTNDDWHLAEHICTLLNQHQDLVTVQVTPYILDLLTADWSEPVRVKITRPRDGDQHHEMTAQRHYCRSADERTTP